MALLLALCILGISCQSTKGIREDLVVIEISHVTYVVPHVVAPVLENVAEQTTEHITHTLESNNRIDENSKVKDSNDKIAVIRNNNNNDKADVLPAVQEEQLDSRDAVVFTKITRNKNDATALLIASSIDTAKTEKVLLAPDAELKLRDSRLALTVADFYGQTEILNIQLKDNPSNTPVETATNGQGEPLRLLSSDADSDAQNNDVQKEEEKSATIWVGEHKQVLA